MRGLVHGELIHASFEIYINLSHGKAGDFISMRTWVCKQPHPRESKSQESSSALSSSLVGHATLETP